MLLSLFVSGCSARQNKPSDGRNAAEQIDTNRAEQLLSLSQYFIRLVDGGDIEAALAMMNDTMKEAIGDQLESVWAQLIGSQGKFLDTGNYIGDTGDDYDALEMTLIFENGTLIQRTVFDEENLIIEIGRAHV